MALSAKDLINRLPPELQAKVKAKKAELRRQRLAYRERARYAEVVEMLGGANPPWAGIEAFLSLCEKLDARMLVKLNDSSTAIYVDWRDGRLVFSRTELLDAVDEMGISPK